MIRSFQKKILLNWPYSFFIFIFQNETKGVTFNVVGLNVLKQRNNEIYEGNQGRY